MYPNDDLPIQKVQIFKDYCNYKKIYWCGKILFNKIFSIFKKKMTGGGDGGGWGTLGCWHKNKKEIKIFFENNF